MKPEQSFYHCMLTLLIKLKMALLHHGDDYAIAGWWFFMTFCWKVANMCRKIDAILDFQIPNIPSRHYVPTNNKYKYCMSLQPILETDRVSREEVVELCCRKMHQVKPKTTHIKEDDVLCIIFTIHAGQNPAFMWTWLKLYADKYQHQFKRVGKEYFKSKVLGFDLWCDSIKDACKGDTMVLLRLNYLMGTHTMVHLSKNHTAWESLPWWDVE